MSTEIIAEHSLSGPRKITAKIIRNGHGDLCFQVLSTRTVTLTQPLFRVYDFLHATENLCQRLEDRSLLSKHDLEIPSINDRNKWDFDRKYMKNEGWGYLYDRHSNRQYAARSATSLPQLVSSVHNVLAHLLTDGYEDLAKEEYENSSYQHNSKIKNAQDSFMRNFESVSLDNNRFLVYKIHDSDPFSMHVERNWHPTLHKDSYQKRSFDTEVRSLVYEPRDGFTPPVEVVKTNFDGTSYLIVEHAEEDTVRQSLSKLVTEDIISLLDVSTFESKQQSKA